MQCSHKSVRKQLFILIAFMIGMFSLSANELPLQKESISRIEYPPEIQYISALIQSKDTSTLVYESWKGFEMNEGDLHYSELNVLNEKIQFDTAKVVLPNKNTLIRSSISHVIIDGVDWLYFIESNGFKSEAIAYRAKFKDSALVEQEKISLEVPLSLSSNARWSVMKNNSVALVYTDKKCCKLYFSISKDGVKFETPRYIGNAGFMPHLSSFSDGKLLYLFQKSFRSSKEKPNGKPIYITKSHFRVSNNYGQTWSEYTPITLTDDTVHDAKAILRLDGNIDIYYVYPIQEGKGLSLWRKCINTNGGLGNEELVVQHDFGNIAKPSIHRLENGKMLVTFVEQGKVVLEGDHNIHGAIISADSECI
ncbi:hypothetical protein [Shewanella kaireitica]|uniref:hypothetical protein n=2 Tax=Shewanella TaxID=22 RepID=UPI0020109987|nr:hypothetical protein [Shewanella kaireitica]MCL1096229.1 hypothetical protein [Shewanella kaireitica]